MTLLEALVGVIAISLLVRAIAFVRLVPHIRRAADDVALAARRVSELAPAAREFIESGRADLDGLRSFTSTATRVAEDVGAVSSQMRAVTSLFLGGLESQVTDRYRAIFAGARAAFGVFRRFRGDNGSQPGEAEEFDHAARQREGGGRDG